MKKLVFLAAALAACLGATACTDPDAASYRALQGMGMTGVVTSRPWFNLGCLTVTGTVCGGYIGKGATVRFD